ncbi:MAG: glycosyltransferase [Actinobacteria bacterium]|nr:glycosyltransferase [Actinomycetota bacterium]
MLAASAARRDDDRRVPVTVVVVTRDRRERLLASLDRVLSLPARPHVVLVDNASSDGTVAAVRRAFPGVEVIALGENLGAAGRNAGVAQARTPFVAFSDDDSWWGPGALAHAARVMALRPRLAVLAARILVGPDERPDPTCEAMRRSPLPRPPDSRLPAILGFVACGAVVRRDAFLAAGGFHPAFGVGGEEDLLALDLAAAGWQLAYDDDLVAHHHPAPHRDERGRRRLEARNALRVAWLRLPAGLACRETAHVLRAGRHRPGTLPGTVDAAREWRWIKEQRRPVPPDVAAARRLLLDAGGEGIS